MDFHGNINLKQNKMQRMVVQSEDNFPVTPIVGRVVFKDAKLYMCVAINNLIPVWLPLTNKIDTYVHTEAVAATTWTVTHNLNTTIPLLQIYNAAGEMLIPDSVTPTSNNIMEVTFSTAIAGTAIVLFGDLMPSSGVGLLEPGIPAWVVDVSLATYDIKTLDISGQTGSSAGFTFSDDGTLAFAAGSGRVWAYSLGTAFDLSTGSYSGNSSTFGLLGNPKDVIFNPLGSKMFIVTSGSSQLLAEFDLLSPFDVTTAVDNGVDISIVDTNAMGLTFNDDGTRIFVVGDENDLVYQYNLGTAYSLTGVVYSGVTMNVSSEVLTPTGVVFNNTGTQMFISGDSGIFQYTLTTGFDIATATYDNKVFDTSSQDVDVQNVMFLPEDGTKMYMLGGSPDTIYQYSTNI